MNNRICEFINAISSNKLNLSKGSIYGCCQAFAQKSEESVEQIYEELMNAKAVYADSTAVTINGKQAYMRNQSINNAVLYSPMEKNNINTLKVTGILPNYCGTLVHDHEWTQWIFVKKFIEELVFW